MIRDGIKYEAMPEELDQSESEAICGESVQAVTGESYKQGAMRLLDHIHEAAQAVNAKLVWVGDLTFSPDRRSAITTAIYMR